jgi:hypothetical protein
MGVSRITEIIASSQKGFDDAVLAGLRKATKTLKGVTGLEVVSLKAKVNEGRVQEYLAKLKITYTVEQKKVEVQRY